MTSTLTSQSDSRWFLERWNDSAWGWAVDRVRRKHDFYWWVGRITYLAGKVIDR